MSIQPTRILTQCPLCHTSYTEKDVHFVGDEGAWRMFHCSCDSCGRSMLAIVLEASSFVSSVGVVTDLQAEDAIRFHGASPISSDDCIRVHELLESQSPAICGHLMGG